MHNFLKTSQQRDLFSIYNFKWAVNRPTVLQLCGDEFRSLVLPQKHYVILEFCCCGSSNYNTARSMWVSQRDVTPVSITKIEMPTPWPIRATPRKHVCANFSDPARKQGTLSEHCVKVCKYHNLRCPPQWASQQKSTRHHSQVCARPLPPPPLTATSTAAIKGREKEEKLKTKLNSRDTVSWFSAHHWAIHHFLS